MLPVISQRSVQGDAPRNTLLLKARSPIIFSVQHQSHVAFVHAHTVSYSYKPASRHCLGWWQACKTVWTQSAHSNAGLLQAALRCCFPFPCPAFPLAWGLKRRTCSTGPDSVLPMISPQNLAGLAAAVTPCSNVAHHCDVCRFPLQPRCNMYRQSPCHSHSHACCPGCQPLPPHPWSRCRRRYVYLFPLAEQPARIDPAGNENEQGVSSHGSRPQPPLDVDVQLVNAMLHGLVGLPLDYSSFARDTPPGGCVWPGDTRHHLLSMQQVRQPGWPGWPLRPGA